MKPLPCLHLLLVAVFIFLSATLTRGQCLATPNPTCSTGITPHVGETPCNATATFVGDPEMYSGECTIAVTRYLARSIEMNFLAEFNYPSPCYGAIDPVTGNTPAPTEQVNCTPPYNHCESLYCPDKYAEMVNSLADMNAQFIRGVYQGAGFREDIFFPGEAWYCLGAQVVRDINYAYDCKGLRRPIIQSNVSELVNLDRFSYMDPHNGGWRDGIDRKIPTAVIDYYFSKFPGDLTKPDPQSGGSYGAYYYGGPHYFERDRITDGGEVDITKVEMRIWFLYQAMTLIDFGYTAIHMGIYWNYAKKERVGNTGGLPVYHNLDTLTTAIRNYAASCGPAHFVLLSGEPPAKNVDNGLSAKVGGTDRFIFDFDSRAMRLGKSPRDQKLLTV